MSRNTIAFIGLLLVAPPLAAFQLSTSNLTDGTTAEALVQSLVGPGISVSNVRFLGSYRAAGRFEGGESILGIEQGVILSSGWTTAARGPNNSDETSFSNYSPGDFDLTGIVSPERTFDAAVLEFDFVPTEPDLSFQYVFASEEYNEFVGSFNDVFGFFVNGQNIALLPGTTTPISIDTVNLNSNPSYYNNNDPSDGGPLYNIEYDGFTTVLTARISGLTPGVSHHIKLAIADTKDTRLDSAVFLAGGSFVSGSVASVKAAVSSTVEEGGAPGRFTFSRTGGDPAEPLTIYFLLSGTASNGIDYQPFPASRTVTIPANMDSTILDVIPIDDALYEGDEPERVIVTLIPTVNYNVSTDNRAVVSISDGDPFIPRVAVSAIDPIASEAGGDDALFLVYRNSRNGFPPDTALTVNYMVGGSATAGQDYAALSGSITLPRGAYSVQIPVTMIDDSEKEELETVTVTLQASAAYDVAENSPATVTIQDGPAIRFFQASSQFLSQGNATTLSWETNSADVVSLNQGIGGVPPTDSLTISPTQSAVYTLTATGPEGTSRRNLPLTVLTPPPYFSFSNFWLDGSGYLQCYFPDPNTDGFDVSGGIPLVYITFIRVGCEIVHGPVTISLEDGESWPKVVSLAPDQIPEVDYEIVVQRAAADDPTMISTEASVIGPSTSPSGALPTDDTTFFKRWLLHIPKRAGGFAGTVKVINKEPSQSVTLCLAGYDSAGNHLDTETLVVPAQATAYRDFYGSEGDGLFADYTDRISHVGIYEPTDQTDISIRYTSLSTGYGAWTSETDLRDGNSIGALFEMEGRSAERYQDGVALLNLSGGKSVAVWVVQRDRETDQMLAEINLGELAAGEKTLSVVSGLFDFHPNAKYSFETRDPEQQIQVLGLSFFGGNFFSTASILKR